MQKEFPCDEIIMNRDGWWFALIYLGVTFFFKASFTQWDDDDLYHSTFYHMFLHFCCVQMCVLLTDLNEIHDWAD